jgi:alpha-D-ribose 1-methylphosphonate 5-triphosphate synthase subunit PhnL
MTHPAINRIMRVQDVAKGFTLHLHGGTRLPVVSGVSFDVSPGECVVLGGPSGAGKSSILKMLYGNYGTGAGRILIRHRGEEIDLASADPRTIIDIRRHTLGYVSQFLRVIPRVSALNLVAEAAVSSGEVLAAAREQASDLLHCLNVPDRLWGLPPATFSGGEQQRINIARGFAGNRRILILDEPTASLDAANREAFIALMQKRKADGTAFIGIFHDDEMRKRVADRVIDVSAYRTMEAA